MSMTTASVILAARRVPGMNNILCRFGQHEFNQIWFMRNRGQVFWCCDHCGCLGDLIGYSRDHERVAAALDGIH